MRLIDRFAVAPDPIARQVRADVDLGAKRRDCRVARLRHGEQRTRLRIGLAEAQEILRIVMRQDREIALHEAGRKAGGRHIERAGAAGAPHINARGERDILVGHHKVAAHCASSD